MSKEKLELGDVAKDIATDFEGVVVGHTRLIGNCDRFVVQPQEVKDGKPVDSMSFDEPRLKFVKKGKITPIPSEPRKCDLGDEVKDPLSGLVGIVTHYTVWNEGCTIVGVQPKELKDGLPVQSTGFDDRKLVVVKAAKTPEPVRRTGGPRPAPTGRRGA